MRACLPPQVFIFYFYYGNFGGQPGVDSNVMMIILLLFLQKQSLAFAVYLFGIGTLLIFSAWSRPSVVVVHTAVSPGFCTPTRRFQD